jgi:ribonuclease T2
MFWRCPGRPAIALERLVKTTANNARQASFLFVVHGLWPQYAKGWLSFETRENWVPQKLIDGMMDVMPSKKLIIHEWKKHGTCSGLYKRNISIRRGRYLRLADPRPLSSPQSPVTVTPGN